MVKPEKETEENPYVLSIKERTCPEGLSKEEKRAWFDEITTLQLEGIKHRAKPKSLYGIPKDFRSIWTNQVWEAWLKTLPEEERRAIRRQVGPSIPRHTRPFARDRRDDK